jgi:hypothetical protein
MFHRSLVSFIKLLQYLNNNYSQCYATLFKAIEHIEVTTFISVIYYHVLVEIEVCYFGVFFGV